jgi:exonuclease VII small subunit
MSTTTELEKLTLEQKLQRLQQIQVMLEEKKVSLSESMPLLEEAFSLKQAIEKELLEMENKLIQISKTTTQSQ